MKGKEKSILKSIKIKGTTLKTTRNIDKPHPLQCFESSEKR